MATGLSWRWKSRQAGSHARPIPAHREGNLLAGARNTHIATLVERHSRYTVLAKLTGKDTEKVVSALICQVRRLPEQLRGSLTWDLGSKMAQH